MLGFDCAYDGGLSLPRAIARAILEERLLLTRRPVAETKRLRVIKIDDSDVEKQILSLELMVGLKSRVQPFTRCLICGELLSSSDPPQFEFELPPRVASRKPMILNCIRCKKVYWEGSHVEKMRERLSRLGFEN